MASKSYISQRSRDSRRDKRLVHPVFEVEIRGENCQTVNWSLGGLLIGPYRGPLQLRELVEGVISGPTRDGIERVPFTARVVRLLPSQAEVALQFEPITDALLRFFDRCLMRRIGAGK